MPRFLANVWVVLRGSALAQLVTLAAMPLLTRWYEPEDFGTFQLFLSLSVFGLVVASARYELALLNAKTDSEVDAGISLCLVVLGASTCLVALGSWLVWAFHESPQPQLLVLVWGLPVATFVGGLAQLLNYVALRKQAYGKAAGAKFAQSSSFVTAALAAGRLMPSAAALVASDLLGRAVAAGTLWRFTRASGAHALGSSVDAMVEFGKRYREFPLVSLPSGLVNTAGAILAPVLMYAAFDARTAGQYSLVERFVMVPIGFIAQAVSQVFMGSFAQVVRERPRDALSMFVGVVRTQMLIGLLPAVVLAAGGPALFAVLFGPDWVVAGEFARILSPLALLTFVSAPVNMLMTIAGQQKAQLAWDVGRLILVGGAWAIAIATKASPVVALVAYVVTASIAQVAYLMLAYGACRRLSSPDRPAVTGIGRDLP